MNPPGPDTRSLYERLGGETAIMAAVALFYDKILADPVTRPFFEGLDMEAQVRKQITFMAWALGGPDKHKGRDLREAHAHLVREKGLGDVHFDAVVRHLDATLRELGAAEPLIQESIGIIAATRRTVLDR